MAEHSFTLRGEQYRVTRESIENRLLGVEPEVIYELAAWVNGRWYPVKQVLATAIGLESTAVNSTSATRHLKHLGFPIWDQRSQGPRPESPGSTERLDPSVRLAALELAVQSAAALGIVSPEDVVAAAETYRLWLAGGV